MPFRARLQAALHEPLVHFLLAGLAVFLFFAWRGTEPDPSSRTITITADQVNRLAENWAATWQRAPSRAEIDGLIRDYIKEEIYTREALRLGLDKDDAVVRRRLRAKMEFLERSGAESVVPDDAALQDWLKRHPGKYAPAATIDFEQVYLGMDDETARQRARAALTKLARGEPWQGVGEPLAVPPSVTGADQRTIADQFGDEFASSVAKMPVGRWAGPVASGFGLHLVRVRHIRPAGKVQLDDVRQQVENDWRAATIEDRVARSYQTLLDGYTIRIEAR